MKDFIEKLKTIAERNYINLEIGFNDEIIVLSHEDKSIICDLSNLVYCLPILQRELASISCNTECFSKIIKLIVSKEGEICLLSEPLGEELLAKAKSKAIDTINLFEDIPALQIEYGMDANSELQLYSLDTSINLLELNDLSPAKAGSIFETVLRSLFPEIFYASLMDPSQKFTESALVSTFKSQELAKRQKYSQDFFYRPEGIDLEITQKCTLACAQCSILSEIKKGYTGLDWSVFSGALNQSADLGMYAYSITGGEPLIRFDDICRILETAKAIECFKIQTNCTYFSSADKSKRIIESLISSGFGNNKITNACLQCSQGIQNYGNNLSNENLFHIARALKPYLNSQSFPLISFGLIYTLDPFINELNFYSQLKQELAEKADIDWSHDRAALRISPVDYSEETADKHWNGNLITLRELLEIRVQLFGNCFHSDLTPWPRMLMRANGEVFACTCFGHVFSLGKFPENSIEELIKIANNIPAFRRIHQEGLLGLLDYVEKNEKPNFGNTLVPGTMTACQLCGLINGARKPRLVNINKNVSSKSIGTP